MKVLNKKDFLKMPAGTFFCVGTQWVFGGLCLKGESWHGSGDFLYVDVCKIAAYNDKERIDRLEDSLEKGLSWCINQDISRGGMHNDDDIFLVYEKEDLEILRSLINAALMTIENNNQFHDVKKTKNFTS